MSLNAPLALPFWHFPAGVLGSATNPIVISDDEEEDLPILEAPTDDEETDDEEEAPVLRRSGRATRLRNFFAPIIPSSLIDMRYYSEGNQNIRPSDLQQ